MSKKKFVKLYLLPVFLRSALSFFYEARLSNRVYSIFSWTLITLITILLACAIWFTAPYLSGKNALFDVEVETDFLELSAFGDVEYPLWEVTDVFLYDGCEARGTKFTGTIEIFNTSDVEFKRNLSEGLEITIINYDDDTSGKITSKNGSELISDCVVIVIDGSGQYAFPIDGVVVIGHEVNSSTKGATLLKSGTVTVADKRIFSGEYYQNDPIALSLGD